MPRKDRNMQVIEKEAFALALLNNLASNLIPLVSETVARQIQKTNDHESMDALIKFLQGGKAQADRKKDLWLNLIRK